MLEALGAVRHHRRLRVNGRVLWIASAVLLAATVGWIFVDAQFAAAAAQLRGIIAVTWGDTSALASIGSLHRGRTVLLGIVVLLVALSLVGSFLGLFFGDTEHRRLRSWLAFTMLIALWLTLLMSWREIGWQGQRLRLRMSLSEFDAIAASLRDDWPTSDGERPGLGSYMAYPQGNPRMLMILSPDTQPPVSAIERSDDGALSFELRADPSGGWLEWHPDGSMPKGFVGGLDQQYDFDRAAPLGRGWYLVRYQR
jgi:hypothetical protein